MVKSYLQLRVLGFEDHTLAYYKDKLGSLEHKDLASFTVDSLQKDFDLSKQGAELIINNRDKNLFGREGWIDFYNLLRNPSIPDVERNLEIDRLTTLLLSPISYPNYEKAYVLDTFALRFSHIPAGRYNSITLPKNKPLINKEGGEADKEEEKEEKVANKEEETDVEMKLSQHFRALVASVTPTTTFTAVLFCHALIHLGRIDIFRCSHFCVPGCWAYLHRPYRGRWTVSQESLTALVRCGRAITEPIGLSMWLDAALATIIPEKGCREVFGLSTEFRDLLLDKLLTPENNLLISDDGLQNGIISKACRVYWQIIANNSNVQQVFCNSSPEVRRKTLAMIDFLGKTANLTSATEQVQPEEDERRALYSTYEELLAKINRKRKEGEVCLEEEAERHILQLKRLTFNEKSKGYYFFPPKRIHTASSLNEVIYEFLLVLFCVAETQLEVRSDFGTSLEMRSICEKFGSAISSASHAEWFAQAITHVVEAPAGSKNMGSQKMRQILYDNRKFITNDTAVYYFCALLTKLSKTSKDTQRLFGSIEIRDALSELSFKVKSARTSQWFCTCIHRMIENNNDQVQLFGTKEFCETLIRIGYQCNTDGAARWFGMALGTITTGLPSEKVRENFGHSDDLRDVLIYVSTYCEESLTLDWFFSVLHKLFKSDKMVLGRFASDEMNDVIYTLGTRCKVQKSKDWCNVVKDFLKGIPTAPPNPDSKKREGKFADKMFIDDDLDTCERNDNVEEYDDDEGFEEGARENKSTLAWLKNPIKM